MSTDGKEASLRGHAALALLGLEATAETHDVAARDTAKVAETGRRVAEARKKSRMSGSELGARVGLGRDQISKIEQGKRRLATRELPEFAAALGVTIRYLLGGDETPRMALAHRLGQAATDGPASMPSGLPGTQRRALEILNVDSGLAARSRVRRC